MIDTLDLTLRVQRHAPFPENDPWTLKDSLTGLPIDLTGATFTMAVKLKDDTPGPPLMSHTVAVVNGPLGQFLISASEALHEALPPAPVGSCGRESELRLRYSLKLTPATGVAWIVARGDYVVQGGAVD